MAPPLQVLFVCVHNAGRSQMAAALLEQALGPAVQVRSAGSEPADRLNPAVVEVMGEVGIDLGGRTPQLLDPDRVRVSDVVITMGCGDTCPVFPGTRYLDWSVDDPAGQPVEVVRRIRQAIAEKIKGLVGELGAQ